MLKMLKSYSVREKNVLQGNSKKNCHIFIVSFIVKAVSQQIINQMIQNFNYKYSDISEMLCKKLSLIGYTHELHEQYVKSTRLGHEDFPQGPHSESSFSTKI